MVNHLYTIDLMRGFEWTVIIIPGCIVIAILVFVLVLIIIRSKRKRNSPQESSSIHVFPATLQLYDEIEQTEIYTVGNAQHIGKREEQQDSFGISDVFNSDEVSQKGLLAVLADGMGGLEHGGECSRKVVSLMLDAFTNSNLSKNIPEGLNSIIQSINEQIYTAFNQQKEESMTGTTTIAVLVKQNRAYWISVGDSRIYLCRNSQLTKLNKEHNYGMKLDEEVLKGTISASDAGNDPNRAALTSYIGIDHLVEIDRNLVPLQLQPGDRIVICSDGVFSTITEEEMATALAGEPQEAAQEIVDRVVAKDRMYQDNATVIVLGYILT